MHGKIIVDGLFVSPRDKLNVNADIIMDYTIVDLFREVYPWVDKVIDDRYIVNDDYTILKQRLKLRYFNLLGDDWRDCFTREKVEHYTEILKKQGPMIEGNALLFARIKQRLGGIRLPSHYFLNAASFYPFGHKLGQHFETKIVPLQPLYKIEGSFSYVENCRAPDYVWDTGLCLVPIDLKVNMKFADKEQVSKDNFVKFLCGQSPSFSKMAD